MKRYYLALMRVDNCYDLSETDSTMQIDVDVVTTDEHPYLYTLGSANTDYLEQRTVVTVNDVDYFVVHTSDKVIQFDLKLNERCGGFVERMISDLMEMYPC